MKLWAALVADTHTRPFNGPFSGTTQLSRYQKGKTNLDFTEARDSEWQWHQLGHMQVYTSLQTDNHASTPPLSFLQAFLLPNQQRQSTGGWMHRNYACRLIADHGISSEFLMGGIKWYRFFMGWVAFCHVIKTNESIHTSSGLASFFVCPPLTDGVLLL